MLEQKLGRALLFLPCRHHISELFIKAVFELNFGKTSAPEVLLFNRFSKFWKNINISDFKSGILDEEVQKVLTPTEIESHKNFCLAALSSYYVRADYKELLQLSLLFIGEYVPNFTQFRLPGATTHARFMSCHDSIGIEKHSLHLHFPDVHLRSLLVSMLERYRCTVPRLTIHSRRHSIF